MAVEGYHAQGTTVTLTNGGAVGCVRSVSLPEFSLEAIDASCLEDAVGGFMKKLAGGLIDAGEVQVTYVSVGAPDVPDGEQDTLTIVVPAVTAGTTPSNGTMATYTISGTGFISSASGGSLEINGLMENSFTFVFDGDTGPTVG
jgi:hypothetical protein